MKFDRRKFFNSIALGLSGVALSEQVSAEVPRERPARPTPGDEWAAQMVASMVGRQEHLWYDTISEAAGVQSRYCYHAFQIPVGNYTQDWKGPRTLLETNMQLAGVFPPCGAIVNRLGFLFHPDMHQDDVEVMSRFGRYEFSIADKVCYKGLFDWAAAGKNAGNPLPRESKFIDHEPRFISAFMFFNLSVILERPHVWKGDLKLLTLLDTWWDRPVQ